MKRAIQKKNLNLNPETIKKIHAGVVKSTAISMEIENRVSPRIRAILQDTTKNIQYTVVIPRIDATSFMSKSTREFLNKEIIKINRSVPKINVAMPKINMPDIKIDPEILKTLRNTKDSETGE